MDAEGALPGRRVVAAENLARAGEHVHAVDLQHALAVQRRLQRARGGRALLLRLGWPLRLQAGELKGARGKG